MMTRQFYDHAETGFVTHDQLPATTSLPRNRRLCSSIALLLVSGFVTLGGSAYTTPAVADETPLGLSAILPSELPDGLASVNFAILPESLQPWATSVKTNLNKLYSFENRSVDAQKQILSDLDEQLSQLYDVLRQTDDPAVADLLADLEGKLARRIDLMRAILDTLAANPDQQNVLRTELAALVEAVEAYESDAQLGNAATRVRNQLYYIGTLIPDNSALENVVQVSYFNYNIRTFVSEPFAEYAFNECRRECGPVCDFILGARVRGTQRTSSGVSINFVPSSSTARFSIDIQGNTKSNTRGVTDQATVFTYGNHYFTGHKVVFFDGQNFGWERARLGVNANNRVVDAKLNRRGLIAKLIGDKIAYDKAVELTPKTERIAAGKLRARVLPKYNSEIEKTFGELNDEQVKLVDRLKQEQLAPNETMSRTDSDELRTAQRLMNSGQLGADRPTTAFNSSTGITVQVHESWINNALARETLNPESNELSFPDFGKMLTSKFERAFNLDIERDEEMVDDGDRLIVYDADPVHVQFDSGKIFLILRIGLRQDGREDEIKLRRVEVPLEISMTPNSIRLSISQQEGDRVRVLPLDPTDRRPIANRIIGNKIQTKIEERLAEKTFDRNVIYKADEDGGKEIPVSIDQLHAVNGWLIAVVEPATKSEIAAAEKAEAALLVEPVE